MLVCELTVTTQRKDIKLITEERLEMSSQCSAEIRKTRRIIEDGIQTKAANNIRSV